MKILFYTPKITARIAFATKVVFNSVLKWQVELTADLKQFEESKLVKLAYSFQEIENQPTVKATGLLHETELEQFDVSVSKLGDTPIFYSNGDHVLGFDVFSAVFFLVTRYEEYWPHKQDKHGRFTAEESIAFKNNFLDQPVVNVWCYQLFNWLKEKYGDKVVDCRSYTFLPTIDVDSAFAYKRKGPIRLMGGLAKALIQFDVDEVKARIKTMLGSQQDPLDVFEYLLSLQKEYGHKTLFFFLVADYGLNDKNVPIYSREFQALIKHINDYAEVGLHPSYASNSQTEKLPLELSRIAETTHMPVFQSRQHFLVFNMPQTFRRLLEAGITSEYSMGYPDKPGFRASTCNPYPFYDLELEQETNLMIHPFSLMEATYKYYLPEDLTAFEQEIKRQVELIKSLKGEFCPLWHNDSISEMKEWKGWSYLYEFMVKEASV